MKKIILLLNFIFVLATFTVTDAQAQKTTPPQLAPSATVWVSTSPDGSQQICLPTDTWYPFQVRFAGQRVNIFEEEELAEFPVTSDGVTVEIYILREGVGDVLRPSALPILVEIRREEDVLTSKK